MKHSNEVLTLRGAICQKFGIAIFAVIVVLAALPLVSVGQITSATIIGTVSDPGERRCPPPA